jgi:hypothetical protein
MKVEDLIAKTGLFLRDDLIKTNLIINNHLNNHRNFDATVMIYTTVPIEFVMRKISKYLIHKSQPIKKH